MARKHFNNVRHLIATEGDGPITFGSVPDGWQGLEDAGAVDGDQPGYELREGDAWELGYATIADGVTTSTRTVVESSNGGDPIELQGGATLTIVLLAGDKMIAPNAVTDKALVSYDGTGGRKLRDTGVTEAMISALMLSTALVGLQLAETAGPMVYGNAVFDAFKSGSLAYVDVAGATNLESGTAGVLKPSITAGPTITSASRIGNMGTTGGQVSAAAFDGVTSANFNNSAVTNGTTATVDTGTAINTGNFGFLGLNISASPKAVGSVRVYGSNDNGHTFTGNPTVTLQLYGKTGSAPANSTDGTLLGSTSFSDSAGADNTVASSDLTTTWNYIWVRVSVVSADYLYLAELVFKEPPTTNSVTVRSAGFAVPAVPTAAKAVIRVKEVDAAVADTDYTLECSRDDGTTWTALPLLERFTSPSPTASIRVVETNWIDISGQPSGSTVRWRFKTLTGKMVEFRGIHLKAI